MSSGFPQLDPSSYPSQIFWLGVTFIAMYLLMSKLALPKVGSIIENRRNKKEGDLEEAKLLSDKAEQLKTTYEIILNESHEEAANILSKTEDDLDEKVAKAQKTFASNASQRLKIAEDNINRAKKEALVSLKDISAEIAIDIVHKVSGLKLSNDNAKKAVNSVAGKD